MIKRILGITISNPNKIIYPNQKITKLDIIKYYQTVAPLMLPFIEDRLLNVVKCHSFINNKYFVCQQLTQANPHIKPYKKNNKTYFYITSQKGIITKAENNALMFYPSVCSLTSNNCPNVMVFNLTTNNLSFTSLKAATIMFKQALDKFNLTSFLKTNGTNGYDIFVPLSFGYSHETIQEIALNIKKYTQKTYFSLFLSKNAICINYSPNNFNETYLAPYSLVLSNNAAISFPICWQNIDAISPNQITIKNYKKYLRKNNWQNLAPQL